MKGLRTYVDMLNEMKGGRIDDQWINDEKPVMTKSNINYK